MAPNLIIISPIPRANPYFNPNTKFHPWPTPTMAWAFFPNCQVISWKAYFLNSLSNWDNKLDRGCQIHVASPCFASCLFFICFVIITALSWVRYVQNVIFSYAILIFYENVRKIITSTLKWCLSLKCRHAAVEPIKTVANNYQQQNKKIGTILSD